MMNALRAIPAFLSFLLIAAHFHRAGALLLVLICLFSTALLFLNRSWSRRVVQVLLFLSALEWLSTLLYLVQLRQEAGLPWIRLAIILGAVLLFTLTSAFILRQPGSEKKHIPEELPS